MYTEYQISDTRKLVRQMISKYYELETEIFSGCSRDFINAGLEGKAEQLINLNPYWWTRFEKPELTGQDNIERFAQAIQAVNWLLVEEIEGVETFEPYLVNV